MLAWRIVKEKHAADAFSGRGAADFGGRWNSRGVAVVYTSGTQSLAALEILVHLTGQRTAKYMAISIEFDPALVEEFPINRPPGDWRQEPPPLAAQQIGDHWVEQNRSPILKLPSVIIPGEPNYVLNPAHPDFSKIVIGNPGPFTLDPRLFAY